MKTKLLLLSIMMMCSMVTFSQSYYYYKGEKKFVNEDITKITVLSRAGKAVKNMKALASDIKEFKTISDTKYTISVYSINAKNRSSVQSSLATVLDEDVIILPCYKDKNGEELIMTNYLSVKLKNETDFNVLSSVAKKYNLEVIKQNSFMPLWYTLSITPATKMTTLDAANEIFESGLFASAFADFTYDAELCSDDPQISTQWGLYNSSNANIDVSICSAWNYATGRGIKIAVVDQGVEKSHSDLAINIHPLSYDTETGTSPSRLYDYHGTHCAGIAAAARNNGIGIAGVAPDAKLMAVSNRLTSASVNMEMKLADGINWAWSNGADIISCSWRANANDILDDAIGNAITKGRNRRGTIVVFAAGNDASEVRYPANSRPEIIAVGAIENTGNRAEYSNYGNTLDVVAPGSDVNSTLLNNSYGYKSGTSMATPHVAGIAALILERNPSLSLKQVSDIIEKNTKKTGNIGYSTNKPNGTWNTKYGYGLVNAHSAVINTPR